MKNYYEVLQVNENASIEVIEKAYKVLVKRYHPDLQKSEKNKNTYEQKLKQINEAYHVLSNEFLREQYDVEFKREKEELLRKKYGEESYKAEKTNFYNNYKKEKNKQNTESTNNKHDAEEKKRQNRNLGTINGIIDLVRVLYESRPKRQEFKEMTKNDLLAIILTILVVIAIGLILFCIPFTRDWMNELLFENPVFKFLGGLFRT